jgi:peptidoglycan/xylan/chitin deacetylase (PgdA/CDA1 family)
MSQRIAVLGFHKIGAPADGSYPTWNYVSVHCFRGYLRQLSDDGWRVLSAEDFVALLDDVDRLPEKSALITFDDGYRSTLTEASPCLEDFKFPAVIFVPTAYVGQTNTFDLDIEPEEQICTWDELDELHRRGVSVQAHGVNHLGLSALGAREVRHELLDCRTKLEERMGRRVSLFAYPYGDAKHQVLTSELLRASGYAAGFLYGGGPFDANDPAFNRFRIPRLALGPDSNLAQMLAETPKLRRRVQVL